jgi:PqqD family protein of HPr-rel-A system
MNGRPSRIGGIEVSPIADGCVVYDPARDRVHQLNRTAAIILEFCDGENTEADIARLLQRTFELPEPPQKEIKVCLDQLRDEGLVR